MHHGSCLCQAVTFEVEGALPGPDGCHCVDCRKFSGHYFASTDVSRAAVTIHGAEHLTWYAADGRVRRGFCKACGSSLFWDPIGLDWIGIAMGAFDGPTATKLRVHVWVSDQGDYYDLADGVPHHQP